MDSANPEASAPAASQEKRDEHAELNKKEYAGTYLVSHLENPEIIKAFLEEIKNPQETKDETTPKDTKKKPKKKKKKKKEEVTEEVPETQILERWDPELVKKTVEFLDGKNFVSLVEIQETIGTTEGEAYWLTQDLIYVGIVPGRWTSYQEGEWKGHWVYQVLTDQPLSKTKPEAKTKKPAKKKSSTTKSKTTTKKSASKKKS